MKKIILNFENVKLSQTDKYIIDKIENNTEQFLDMTISQFAKYAYCSISAISRLTSRIGFKNYTMFKLHVMSEYSSPITRDNKSLYKNIDKKMEDLAAIYQETVARNIIASNQKTIDEMSDNIIKAKRVIVYGSGSSSLPVQHLSFNLEKIGINCFYNPDFHKTLHNIMAYHEKQILVLFSKALESKEIKFLLNIANKKNITTYLFSASKDAYKIKRNNIVLFKSFLQKKWQFSISSKIAGFYNVDLLLLYIYEKLKINSNNEEIIHLWNHFK